MGGVGEVAAIDLARGDRARGRAPGQHGADLHRRGMGPQQRAPRHVERVLHVAGGMVVGEIEGPEIVVVALDFRTLRHREAQPLEDLDDLVLHLREGMEGAGSGKASRQRQVHALGGERAAALVVLERHHPCLERSFELGLDLVGLGPHQRPLRRRQRAQRAEERGQLPRSPQDTNPERFEVGRGAGPSDIRQGPITNLLDPRVRRHAQARPAARAVSASFAKAVGSWTASSARIFRSSATPAFLRPFMNTE